MTTTCSKAPPPVLRRKGTGETHRAACCSCVCGWRRIAEDMDQALAAAAVHGLLCRWRRAVPAAQRERVAA